MMHSQTTKQSLSLKGWLLLSLFYFVGIASAVDLSGFTEECPCLKAFGIAPLFSYFAIDLDSCFAICMGFTDCVAFSFCENARDCKGYNKYGVGYYPEAIKELDCDNYPSEPDSSSLRWYWVKETLNGETTDCQIEHDRLSFTPASKRYPIKIRGYEITVYCEWGQNGAPTLTYFEQQGGDPSYVLWGGSIYSTEPKYSTSRREWQQARIEVNRCFVALDIKDISHSTITSGSSYPDNFEYMYFGTGGDCRSSLDEEWGQPGEARIDLVNSPFMFPAGLYFDFTGWGGHSHSVDQTSRLLTMSGSGGCGLGAALIKDPVTRIEHHMHNYFPLNLFCFDCG
ncbi:uncharacterized protein LOC142335529 [Convolutriloba macropyga]|uniref:uncharacterized protein LOC142335529 n=1 Tax=Convolutriloba macropyga TaxID=536237 RepID=UPI003F51C712